MEENISVRRRGLVKSHVGVDYEVWRWKNSQEMLRGEAKRVTKKEVKNYAIEAYNRAGITNFKASDGWYRRWRVRWQLPSVIKSMEKNAEAEMKQNIYGIQPLIKNDVGTNIQEINIKEDTSLLKNNLTEVNNDVKLANRLYIQTEHNQLTPFDSNILEFSNSLKPDEVDSSVDVCLNQNKSKNFKSISECSTISDSSFEDNKDILTSALKLSVDNSIKKVSVSTDFTHTTSFLADSTNENLGASGYCTGNVLNKNIFITNNSIAANPIESNHKELIEISNVYEPHCKKLNSKDNKERCTKELCRISDHKCSDELRIKDGHSSFSSLNFFNNNDNSDLRKGEGGFQSDGRLSLPSLNCTNNEFYHVTSSLYDQNSMVFEDHDLFCDSCEDFHPRTQATQKCCHKHKKVIKDSLLSGVLEKKETSVVKPSSFDKKPENKHLYKSSDEDIRLKTPNVVFSKGKRYLVQFKSKVVNYALNYNVKLASSKFNVNRGTVSEWLAEHKRLSGEKSTNLSVEKIEGLSEDCDFLKWLKDSKFNLTCERIRQKTTEWLEKNENNTKCQWLRMYAHRLNGTEDRSIKKRYIAYPDVFKQIAVFHAQTHSNLAAARVFGVARRRILEWTQMSGRTKEKVSTVIAANNVTDEAVDRQVFEWYKTQEVIPSSKQVRCKAVELYRAAGHEKILCGSQWYYRWRARHKLLPPRRELYNDPRLISWVLSQLDHNQTVSHSSLAAQAVALGYSSVSRGWSFRFCKKHYKLMVDLPEYTTPLPPAMELQVLRYREHLQNTVSAYNYMDINIIAMDEIPLHFLQKDQGKKPLLVRRPGFESCQASLVVSCLSDGTLLPSLFVFKGAVPTCESDPHVISAASDTGIITEDIMLMWLKNVCFKQLQNVGGVLITDCFHVHTTQQIQQALKEHHINQAVIPEGCAFKLLPVIKVCQLFKSMLEELCQLSLANQLTALKTPSPDQLYHWSILVHKKLVKLQKENLQVSFKEMLFGSTQSTL